mgnify:CR=1 FL=1
MTLMHKALGWNGDEEKKPCIYVYNKHIGELEMVDEEEDKHDEVIVEDKTIDSEKPKTSKKQKSKLSQLLPRSTK